MERAARSSSSAAVTRVAPSSPARSRSARVLRRHQDLAARFEVGQGSHREQAESAGADHRDRSRPDAERGVKRARRRLDDDGGLVGQAVGHGDELCAVRDHRGRPATTRARAVAALQPGLQRAMRQALAAVGRAGSARGAAGLYTARGAAEHRYDHRAGEGSGRARSGLVDVDDDLVPGGEREAHERLEPPRRGAVERGEVRAADACQAGPYPQPPRPGQLGWFDVAQLDRADTGPPPGHDAPDDRRRCVAHRPALEDQRLHHWLRRGVAAVPGRAGRSARPRVPPALNSRRSSGSPHL